MFLSPKRSEEKRAAGASESPATLMLRPGMRTDRLAAPRLHPTPRLFGDSPRDVTRGDYWRGGALLSQSSSDQQATQSRQSRATCWAGLDNCLGLSRINLRPLIESGVRQGE